MSEVRLVVREAEQDWSGKVHGSDADRTIAALSADPVTMAELKSAAIRFLGPDAEYEPLNNLGPRFRDEPYDAGLVIIDLTARLIVVDSTYSSPGPSGSVWYRDEENKSGINLPYHLSDDWLFVHESLTWKGRAKERRQQRSENPPLDARAILYGRPLLEFVSRNALLAFQSGTEASADDTNRVYDTLKNIHAEWLLTPRDDLRGVSPRDVMLERRSHLTWDLQDRSEQWSLLGQCPPGLQESSFAFRYGGFGTHELVMYYEMIRELLRSTWSRLEELSRSPQLSCQPKSLMPGDFLSTEVSRLEHVRDEWLDAPDIEFHMRTPRSIIDRERRRLPEAGTGEEAMIDPDCPCCQMMGDMPGPFFWHLDGCEMDDDFAFDISHRTREEWDAEERRREEFNKRFNAEQEERRRLGVSDRVSGESGSDSLWTSTYLAGESADMPLTARVFGIGCRLAELICDLRGAVDRDETPQSVQQLIDQLNRNYGNFRELLNSEESVAEALFDPVIDSFVETLNEVIVTRPDLAPKCEDLTQEIKNVLKEPPPTFDGESSDLDIPF